MKVFDLLSWQRSLLLLILCHEVAANTEIITFSPSREWPVDLFGNCSKLHPSDNERQWTLEPAALHTPLHQVCEHPDAPSSCPHALWVLLDLDDEKWASYSTFTLRLSWPASHPVEVTMALYTPHDLARLSGADTHTPRAATLTRARYARVHAVPAGVPIPRRGLPRSPAAVPVRLRLEPVYMGLLPATVLPTLGVIVPVLLVALCLVVPWVLAFIAPYAHQARIDLNAGMTRTRKQL